MADQKHRVAVLGATGQVGTPLSEALLRNGHAVLAITRGESARVEALRAAGASVAVLEDPGNEERLAEELRAFGADTVVVASRSSAPGVVDGLEPRVLRAAVASGTVRRFVPTEFGCHTKAMDYGVGSLFDRKKDFQKKLFASGLDWTLVYTGGFFDYFVPNLRYWDHLTTFGRLDLEFPVHDIRDVGELAARAVVDPRLARKCVQLYGNLVTQAGMVETLRRNFPAHEFEVRHHSSEEILRLRDEAEPGVITAVAGHETDQERWGINHCIYTLGGLAAPNDPDTLLSTDLWPDFQYRSPEVPLASREFVFGDGGKAE